MSKFLVQRGYNSKYPEKIEFWRIGDDIPEWISDKAKVIFIDGEGKLTLEMTDTSTGGVEIMDSSGTRVLIRLESKKDYVCINSSHKGELFTLSQKQLDLLYR